MDDGIRRTMDFERMGRDYSAWYMEDARTPEDIIRQLIDGCAALQDRIEALEKILYRHGEDTMDTS